MLYEEYLEMLRKFYGSSMPNTVLEYTGNYPKGFGRTAVRTKFGKTISEVLLDINSNYTKTNDIKVSINNVFEECKIKSLEWLNEKDYSNSKLNNLELKCITCGSIFTTSYSSLKLTKYGCSTCAGNPPLKEDSFNNALAKVVKEANCSITEYPEYNNKLSRQFISGLYIKVKCNICESEFTRELSWLYYRQQCRCPKCFPSKVYPVYYNNIQFNSKFERDCYIILVDIFSDLEIHKKYKELIPEVLSRYSMDFYLPSINHIIEVTLYKESSEYFDRHRKTLVIKENLAIKNNIGFSVVRSLPELEELIKLLKDIV